MASLSTTPNLDIDPLESDIQHIKTIADAITSQVSKDVQWSTYHNWKLITSLKATNTPGKIAEYQSHWQDPQNFPKYGTCVDFAYLCTQMLRASLSSIPTLSTHAPNVKLYASRDTDGTPEHVIAGLQLGTSILLLDPCFTPLSMLLRTGEKSTPVNTVTFDNDLGNTTFKWFCLKKAPQKSSLVHISGSSNAGTKACGMSEISWDDAIGRLSFAMAAEMRTTPGGRRVPESQYMISEQLLEEKPEMPYVETADGFSCSTCKVGFYAHSNVVVVMIPVADWLEKVENRGYKQRLEDLGIRVTMLQGAMGRLEVQASGPKEVVDRLHLVTEIVAKLGIGWCEFLHAVEDVGINWRSAVKPT